MKKFGFTRKIFDDCQRLPLLLYFFRQNPVTISMILFRNVSLSRNPFWEVCILQRKVTIFIVLETKIHILPTKINETEFAKVSPSNVYCSSRII